ncbi:MAG: 30S ribosomal protein S4 [Candidatus Kerfeldbacteria bacterium CG15_BIG_FIL_POST_REV_8_21_14_020_45_12]|uniref:Small ribosomal subunit protein uS4 n=1 Tax=Candidatus Kerfeldbacteria bacterium CG15_BIG_FIL_POST_REV_8_21_14_020_45_12 TaxID=2014247 RepID=A0A2M7H5E3_9BACT|nr:MAG: 30S ribosomal protein S4 [Candidatus Kerfeldbacteria bacterium CG15_BIG_FIL_POST_REV_8_21_14_020_45_12]PJA93053.1 MAG: 30S ribosomal protein S4 [Candidatus Kerfeldbacteria bacterium CG_4_9_14_3_um_filter_45_8]
MGRYTGPKCKPCRRIGESVCGTQKCAVLRRSFIPGQHGPTSRPRLSEYGTQLREKQKARHLYGVLERQFRNYYEQASRAAGNTGELLLQLLERRLDNAVYRAGFAETRRQARQMVGHGHFNVNGRRVDIPSYKVSIGDVIVLRDKSQKSALFNDSEKDRKTHQAPKWLKVDMTKSTVEVTSLPNQEDFEQNIAINLIVEYYSR